MLKAQIFQLFLPNEYSQTSGNWHVNIHGLLGNSFFLFGGMYMERAQIVNSVGKFDQNNTNIVCHRHEHATEIRRFGMLRRFKLHIADFTDTFNEMNYLAPEFPLQYFLRQIRVFQGIVQNPGNYAALVHVNVSKKLRHFKRVSDVLPAGLAHLTFMRFAPDTECFFDLFYFRRGLEVLQRLEESFELLFFFRTPEFENVWNLTACPRRQLQRCRYRRA